MIRFDYYFSIVILSYKSVAITMWPYSVLGNEYYSIWQYRSIHFDRMLRFSPFFTPSFPIASLSLSLFLMQTLSSIAIRVDNIDEMGTEKKNPRKARITSNLDANKTHLNTTTLNIHFSIIFIHIDRISSV